jgi:hypothetical protein
MTREDEAADFSCPLYTLGTVIRRSCYAQRVHNRLHTSISNSTPVVFAYQTWRLAAQLIATHLFFFFLTCPNQHQDVRLRVFKLTNAVLRNSFFLSRQAQRKEQNRIFAFPSSQDVQKHRLPEQSGIVWPSDATNVSKNYRGPVESGHEHLLNVLKCFVMF